MNSRSFFWKQHILLTMTIVAAALLFACLRLGKNVPIQRGLSGYYYTNIDWKEEPVFSVIESELNLNTTRVRRLTFPHRMYSIYWIGWIHIERPGEYVFTTRSDDGSSLSINKRQLIDNGGFHGTRERSESIELEAGFHQIEIRYFQGKAKDECEIFWQPPGQDRDSIPSDLLFPEKPSTKRLFLERFITQAILALTIVTLLLFGLTLIFHGKSLYQHVKQLTKNTIRPLAHLKEWTGICWRLFVSSKTWRVWTMIGLGGLLFLFLGLYWIQADHGLNGRYYNNLDWSEAPIFSTLDTSLTPQHLYQKAHRPQEPNSLQWDGWIWIPASQNYYFTVTTEGLLVLTIDDVIVTEKENNLRIQSGTTQLYLSEGFHRIVLQYRPGTGTPHILDLQWGTQAASTKVIAGEFLFSEQPDDRQPPIRAVLTWLYRQVKLFWIFLIAIAGISILLHQHSIFAWLQQSSGYQKMIKLRIFRDGYENIPMNANVKENSSSPPPPKLPHQRGGMAKSSPLALRRGGKIWVHILLIIVFSLLLVFNNLGRGSIITTDFDEGMHTRVAQYMAKTGIWWSLYSSEGIPYYNKPPLKIWLSALTFRFLGDSEFFIRMWDAIFGLLLFIVLYFFGSYLFSNTTLGFLAVLILMGCHDFLLTHSIRTGVMDSLMLFFFVSALFCFRLRERQSYFYYLAGFCLGLGALTKSVQALVPLGIILIYLVLTKRYAELKSRPFWGMVFLSLLLPALWYIPQFFVSPRFFDVAIMQQIVHRVQGKIHRPHLHGPFYFFQVIYHGFFPWSLIVLPAMGVGFWQALRRKNDNMIFLLMWILTVFIGFSFSKMKVVWYMNPLYPALSLLIAAMFSSAIITPRFRRDYPLLPYFAKGLLGILLVISLYANYQQVRKPVEKLPVHIFTDYLRERQDEEYRVIAYNLAIRDLDNADLYYLDRVADRVSRTDDIVSIQQQASQQTPLFILLKQEDYDTQPFFRKHLYHYWLAPVYANKLYPQKLILVYNDTPSNEWFIKNRHRE